MKHREETAGGLVLVLDRPLALSWSSSLLTLSEQSDEVLVERTGLTMAQIDQVIQTIHANLKEDSPFVRISLAPGWEGAAEYGFSSSYALVHDMQITALTGWTKEKRLADEAALLRALTAARKASRQCDGDNQKP